MYFRADGRIQKPGKRATRLFAETNGSEEFAESPKSSVGNAQTKHSSRSVMMSSNGISREKRPAKWGISAPASILEVAAYHARQADFVAGLQCMVVAAVGPIVATELVTLGIMRLVMPPDSFSMKPLVNAVSRALQAGHSSRI